MEIALLGTTWKASRLNPKTLELEGRSRKHGGVLSANFNHQNPELRGRYEGNREAEHQLLKRIAVSSEQPPDCKRRLSFPFAVPQILLARSKVRLEYRLRLLCCAARVTCALAIPRQLCGWKGGNSGDSVKGKPCLGIGTHEDPS
jgi:hypothetical protein